MARVVTHRGAFIRGLDAGAATMLAVQALHWLITPASHPGASAGRHGFVVVQLAACLLFAVWMTRGIPASS